MSKSYSITEAKNHFTELVHLCSNQINNGIKLFLFKPS